MLYVLCSHPSSPVERQSFSPHSKSGSNWSKIPLPPPQIRVFLYPTVGCPVHGYRATPACTVIRALRTNNYARMTGGCPSAILFESEVLGFIYVSHPYKHARVCS